MYKAQVVGVGVGSKGYSGRASNANTDTDPNVHTQSRLFPTSPSFIFPGLALTATWASFHSGLGCGARSWETWTAGPVSQNKARKRD